MLCNKLDILLVILSIFVAVVVQTSPYEMGKPGLGRQPSKLRTRVQIPATAPLFPVYNINRELAKRRFSILKRVMDRVNNPR